MTLPFGTRVTERHTDPNVCGIVLRLPKDAAEYGEEEYVVLWPSGQETLERRADLTVVESAAESALREIGRMLDLPSDADPAAIVEALRSCVADKGRVLGRPTREDPPASVEESVWGEP